jgi:hypothetical protein
MLNNRTRMHNIRLVECHRLHIIHLHVTCTASVLYLQQNVSERPRAFTADIPLRNSTLGQRRHLSHSMSQQTRLGNHDSVIYAKAVEG